MMNELPDNVKNLIAILKKRAVDQTENDDILCIIAAAALDSEDNINDDLINELTEWINRNPSADIRHISDHLFSSIPYSDTVTGESA